VDLGIKGLSQFIFRRMAEEFRGFTYINAMDDSGLESLRRQKLSYRPVRQIPSFVIARYEKT
jgi:hypothetical protein